MRLNAKGRYAVTSMLDLALHSDKGPISLAGISRRQDISLSYLEQLFCSLRKYGLVKSVRGPGGGYRLSREASRISVAEVIGAVNVTPDVTRCGGSGDCQKGETCLTHHLWADLSQQIHDFLDAISLQDLMSRREVKEISENQDTRLSAQINLDRVPLTMVADARQQKII
ncbi:MAG: Rrf2 family transcriptional regulator [Gammaproteobacteria bacterium]|nr:Rrf2 family transcriptional regulator [Gammaproteobacteria bacterium]MCY4357181.1 Rrf2 family transcriptional regulator [Gammaproteobacteria bacterium]